MVSFTHIIKDKEGLHARPAGMLMQVAKECNSNISISLNGKTANSKRIFSIMGLCAKVNDQLEFQVEGGNENSDAAKLKAFCEANL